MKIFVQALISGIILLVVQGVAHAVPPTCVLDTEFGSNGVYTLSSDRNCQMVINRSNVTLDLNGYTVYGDGTGVGIKIEGQTNVRVTSGTVRSFGNGVSIVGGGEHRISHVVSSNNYGDGFRMEDMTSYSAGDTVCFNCRGYNNGIRGFNAVNSRNIVINGGRFEYNGNDGIRVKDSDYFELNRPISVRNRNGYTFDRVGFFVMDDLQSFANRRHGIEFVDVAYSTLDGCQSDSNDQSGVYVSSAYNFTLSNCEAENNLVDGYRLGGSRITFSSSSAANNYRHGISTQFSQSTLKNSLARANGVNGIDFRGDNNDILNNESRNNSSHGFRCSSASGNHVHNNIASGNGGNPYYRYYGCTGNHVHDNSWN